MHNRFVVKVVVYIMLFALVVSTLLFIVEPLFN